MSGVSAAHRLLVAGCVAGAALGIRPARGSPGRFELAWSAPTECPSADEVKLRVVRMLDRPLELPDDQVLLVRARVRAPSTDAAWRVDVETDNGQRGAKRALVAASCDELANATAIVVAILLEPPAEPSSVAPARAPAPTPTPVPAPARADGSEARSPLVWSLGADGGVITGMLPRWSPGFGVRGGLTWKLIRAQLGGTYWLPTQQSLDASGSQGADFELLSGQAQLCVRWPAEPVQPALCAGAVLALLRAEGFGPGVSPEVERARFVSISAGPSLVWRHSRRWSFVFEIAALLPLERRQFVLTGSDPAVVYAEETGLQLKCGAEFNL